MKITVNLDFTALHGVSREKNPAPLKTNMAVAETVNV